MLNVVMPSVVAPCAILAVLATSRSSDAQIGMNVFRVFFKIEKLIEILMELVGFNASSKRKMLLANRIPPTSQ
jgi:hypothetical protein